MPSLSDWQSTGCSASGTCLGCRVSEDCFMFAFASLAMGLTDTNTLADCIKQIGNGEFARRWIAHPDEPLFYDHG